MFLQLTGAALYNAKPDRLLRKPQQTCHRMVEGLDAHQQSPIQRSVDTELHAFLPPALPVLVSFYLLSYPLLVAIAIVYLLPSPTCAHPVFHNDHELGRIPMYLPVVG